MLYNYSIKATRVINNPATFLTTCCPPSRPVVLVSLGLGLLFFFCFLYDDATNPDQQDYRTHMKILKTRLYPQTTRPRTCNGCNVYAFKTLIAPRGVCSGQGVIDLLIFVTTIPKDTAARRAIRTTWGLYTKNNSANVRLVFLFGSGWDEEEQGVLGGESALYGDVLQDDYKDAYYNLSYKIVSGYTWAMKDCPRAKFVLRTADDNFVNVPRILQWVRTEGAQNTRVQIGHIFWDMKVYRYPDKKWYVSYKEFPEEVYPPYAVGTAFLLAMEAVDEIVKAAPNIPFFCIEDAWFGLLMREIEMKPKEVDGFDVLLVGRHLRQFQSGTCPLYGGFYGLHLVGPKAMAQLWSLCTVPTQTI